MEILDTIYFRCRSIVEPHTWDRIVASCPSDKGPKDFPNILLEYLSNLALPRFLPDLAQLEWALYEARISDTEIPPAVDRLCVNPTLGLHRLSWKNLIAVIRSDEDNTSLKPEPGEELVMVWREPHSHEPRVDAASHEDLLVLKMVVEGIDAEEVARIGRLPIAAVDSAVDRSVARGIVLTPRSGIRRDPGSFPVGENTDECFLSCPVFVLQWHVTQACDLNCKHCYDRSKRSPLTLDQGLRVLDDLRSFCRSRYVGGQVTFTGGNPLLYPYFFELYRAASERGFALAILGNPSPREQIEELLKIQRLTHYQVSLEGLPDHNDMMRGPGHFDRTIEFLSILQDLEVPSMVMLTLTKDNIDHVLPLADILHDRTDAFTFNRLSMVGEAANLELPSHDDYKAFLEEYRQAAERNPILGLKDNLFNILLFQKGLPLFGGCTGYGCGAAFNFIALLPDGEAHACRKFPSLIGNIHEQSIGEIYDSELARRYRNGTNACRSCNIRPVCGGCLAVTYSCGLNIFEDRDPYCLM